MKIKNFSALCAGAFLLIAFIPYPGKTEVSVSFSASVHAPAPAPASAEINFNELNDYGEWVHVHGLGRVWRPDAEPGWRPFMYGRWVYSNDGWLWDSDEPFGWIVCHYGYWYDDEQLGWVWVPGDQWSPARVEWYVTDNEIGWAPLFPPGYRKRFIRDHWLFSPTPFFASADVRSHIEVRARPSAAGGVAKIRVYTGAPRIDFVERFTPAPIVRITPRKVRVTEGPHPFVRMEIEGGPRPDVVVPVRSKSRKAEVRVEQERGLQKVVPTGEVRQPVRPAASDDRRVIVRPKPQDQQDNGVRARVRSRDGGDDNDQDRDNRRRNR